VYVDGRSTLTCDRHAQLAARGGGFALELVGLPPLVHAHLDTATMVDQLRAAHRSENDWHSSEQLGAP
jgi:hypothetical protein